MVNPNCKSILAFDDEALHAGICFESNSFCMQAVRRSMESWLRGAEDSVFESVLGLLYSWGIPPVRVYSICLCN